MLDNSKIDIQGLILDRSNWKRVKFGDVAIKQKQSVDRENTELTRYVKGEHMGSQDLHLRSWGELTDDDLDYEDGKEDELLGRIQKRTGESK